MPNLTTIHGLEACSMYEIKDLAESPTPLEALKVFWKGYLSKGKYFRKGEINCCYVSRLKPFVIFSSIVEKGGNAGWLCHPKGDRPGYGEDLAKYVLDNKLGSIIECGDGVNWTRNVVRMWVFKPDYPKLGKFMEAYYTANPDPPETETLKMTL